MKRIVSFVLVLSLLVCSNLFADLQSAKDVNNVVTVEELGDLSKGTTVILKGNIIKKIRNKFYLFKDTTGKVNLNISPIILKGIVVAPNTKVIIYGIVDSYMRSGMGKSIMINVSKVKLDETPSAK